MLSRLVLSRPVISTSLLKNTLKQFEGRRITITRSFTRGSKDGEFWKTRTRASLKEHALGPPGPNAFAMGKGAAAGAAAIGLGALCFYGLGLGKEEGIKDHAMLWPEHVKQRIRTTYGYFAASLAISAASSIAVFRSPTLLRLTTQNGFLSVLATMALMIGSGMATQAIPYSPGLGLKQFAWMAHCAILGGVIAPICFLGGPLLMRAAWMTGGVVGSLSTLAVCAPSDKFLFMGGPLAIGLGIVFASSLANVFLPPTTALGAGLYSMSVYGGLILFSGFLLYDTQRIVKIAENYPVAGAAPYDPINMAISIYLDTLQIFIRIAQILAMGGDRRRK